MVHAVGVGRFVRELEEQEDCDAELVLSAFVPDVNPCMRLEFMGQVVEYSYVEAMKAQEVGAIKQIALQVANRKVRRASDLVGYKRKNS